MVMYMWVWWCTCGYGGVHVGMVMYMWVWWCTCGYGGVHVGMVVYMWVWWCTCGYGGVHVGMVVLLCGDKLMECNYIYPLVHPQILYMNACLI